MSKRQLALFFFMQVSSSLIGAGLLPLLPVYATRLGARPAVVGYYLSAVFLALALGALGAGPLFERTGRAKGLLVAGRLLSIPLTWLMGRVENVWQLGMLNAASWFLGGLGLALISIRTGLDAGEGERGRAFGILSVGNGFGMLIGGLTLGTIADRWGYPTLFSVAALSFLIGLIPALLIRETAPRTAEHETAPVGRHRAGLGLSFHLLFVAILLIGIAGNVSTMGRSLAMDTLGFSGAAISSTVAICGMFSIPLPFLMGWLSDRIGRKQLLAVCYLALMTCLLILSRASALWHFWAAFGIASLNSSSLPVGSALVADLLPRESRVRGMARFNSGTWIAGVLGLAITGNAIQTLGLTRTFIAGACLPLVAVILVAAIRRPAVSIRPAPTGGPLGSE